MPGDSDVKNRESGDEFVIKYLEKLSTNVNTLKKKDLKLKKQT